MRTYCLSLFFLTSVILNAQDVRKVSCRFMCFEGVPQPPTLLTSGDKGAEVSCSVPVDAFSPVTVCVAKGNVLDFISSLDRKPAAKVAIPPAVQSAILVFVPPAKTPGALPWRIYLIEDTDKNFPDGGAFVANFHDQDIRFVIGNSKVQLHPGGSHGVTRPEPRDPFNMAEVVIQFYQDDTWKTASETMLRFVPGMRYLIFTHVNAASGRPSVCTIQDFKPFVPPAPRR